MPKYRKKPVVVEAVKYAKPYKKVRDWFDSHGFGLYRTLYDGQQEGGVIIQTLEGEMRADIGDYIIRGVQGEFYPCKPDIFEATYELVQEDAVDE